jgi:hypothetical protein
LTSGLPKFESGVKTTIFGICALSFLGDGAGCGETDADAGCVNAGVGGAGVEFGGGCATATIEAAATANMTIVLFITQPRPIHHLCQGGRVPRKRTSVVSHK